MGRIGGLFRHADGIDKLLMLIGTLGSIGDGLMSPLNMFILSGVIEEYATSNHEITNDVVDKYALRLLYVALGVGVSAFLEGVCWTRTAERQTSRIRMEYLRSVLRQEVGFFDNQGASSTTFRVVSSISADAHSIQAVIAEKIPNCLVELSAFIFGLLVAFILSWRLALASLPCAVCFIVPGVGFGKLMMSLGAKSKEAYDVAGGIVEQCISSIRTVYSYVGETQTLERFSHALQESMKLGIKQGFAKGLMIGSMGTVFATWAFESWAGSILVVERGESGGRVFIAAVCVVLGGLSCMSALPNLSFIVEASAAATRIFEMIDRIPEIDSEDEKGKVLSYVHGEIEFKEVHFRYPTRMDTPILQGFNLKVKPGKTVGLVGGSGSQKHRNGSDTISADRSLLPNETIISKNGKFELGFFVPGNSTNYYIGIWYKNIPGRTVVWVLNRNHPIPHSQYNYSQLQISNGTLLLRSGSDIFWSYNEALNATEAVVLDTGDFVLRNASGILWRSFEHPTDTWLPGAALGYPWFTDDEPKLVSWTNPNDPASGTFSLALRPNGGSKLFVAGDGTEKWKSGPWKGGTFLSLSDNSDFNSSYNFTQFSREGNIYVTYNVYNESVLSRIVMSYAGRMIQYRWSEGRQAWVVVMVRPYSCSVYASCGPNTICNMNDSKPCMCLSMFQPKVQREWDSSDFSNGCVRREPLECDDKVGFMKVRVRNNTLPANPMDLPNNTCELFCSSNCPCNAYAYDSGGQCLLFMADLLEMESTPNISIGVDLFIKLKPKGKRKVPIVALVVPITAAVLISCFGLCYLWLKNTKSREKHQNLLLLDLSSNGQAYKQGARGGTSGGEAKSNQHELPIFSFSSIVVSTNNFSITNKLGEGGFGPVYRGELHNKQFVAVKRLSKRSGQGLEEFRNEIELIAKLQHRNLVGILGCCIENEEKILVYEYMSNKSLDFFIFDATRKDMMDWTKRVHIISGIAQGLLYLHHYSRLRIVHRDLKASNILLDSEMNPKISDFGMARIFGGNDSQVNTERIVGTYGYMSPEYAMEGLFSVKSDVFAFGVLMLEIISGKKNTGFYGSNYLSLLGYAWNMWKEERVLELVDPILEIPAASSSSAAALRYIKIGLLCVQENPVDRPLMSDVVDMLHSEDAEIPTPMNPAFTVTRTSATPHKLQIYSVNGLTLSHVEPR